MTQDKINNIEPSDLPPNGSVTKPAIQPLKFGVKAIRLSMLNVSVFCMMITYRYKKMILCSYTFKGCLTYFQYGEDMSCNSHRIILTIET